MTTQEKARMFIEHLNRGDARCDHVIAMLSGLFNLTHLVIYDRIKEIADATRH